MSNTKLDAMAEMLIERGFHRCVLSTDPDYGWVDGLKLPMNDPDDGEHLEVAHLDLDDGQAGPMLWDFAVSVLKARTGDK